MDKRLYITDVYKRQGILFDKRTSITFKLKNLMNYGWISTTGWPLVSINTCKTETDVKVSYSINNFVPIMIFTVYDKTTVLQKETTKLHHTSKTSCL